MVPGVIDYFCSRLYQNYFLRIYHDIRYVNIILCIIFVNIIVVSDVLGRCIDKTFGIKSISGCVKLCCRQNPPFYTETSYTRVGQVHVMLK